MHPTAITTLRHIQLALLVAASSPWGRATPSVKVIFVKAIYAYVGGVYNISHGSLFSFS